MNGIGSFPAMEKQDNPPTLKFADGPVTTEQPKPKAYFTGKPTTPHKEPVRIVLFYEDGTFQSFDAKK